MLKDPISIYLPPTWNDLKSLKPFWWCLSNFNKLLISSEGIKSEGMPQHVSQNYFFNSSFISSHFIKYISATAAILLEYYQVS